MATHTLVVKHVDNLLQVFIHGDELVCEYVDNDPRLNQPFDLTPKLRSGENVLRVVGSNGPQTKADQVNPWHFEFEVRRDDEVILSVVEKSPPHTEPEGVKLKAEYVIEND